MRTARAAVWLLEQDIRPKRRSSDTARLHEVLAYLMQTAVVIKTHLEVPDNRLCNGVTLCDCEAQMMLTLFCPLRAKCDRLV